MALPALKMVLTELEKDNLKPSSQNANRKVKQGLTEETVMKIINRLNKKD